MFAVSKTLNVMTAFVAASLLTKAEGPHAMRMAGAAQVAAQASFMQCARLKGESDQAYARRLWPVFMGALVAALRRVGLMHPSAHI